jgi:hypothetical protein
LSDDEMPIATTYKGVRIHRQPAKRIALVKKELDRISKLSEPMKLFDVCGDPSWSPEARMLAGARYIVSIEIAREQRTPQPDHTREDVEARIAGLNSRTWADPERYCCLCDIEREHAAEREVPLDEE